ncbi:hypothetical protein N7490_006246 [Penicillium lividum]|nr:hypothetical protein N7490_006246 [Penicillium lividum]
MTYSSRLLVTNVSDREYILYCEAEITTELLNGLRNPRHATSPMKWPTIRRKKLPYQPYHTLPGRLIDELVTPSPLYPHVPLNPSADTDGAIKNGSKRYHDQEGSGSYKLRRISTGGL